MKRSIQNLSLIFTLTFLSFNQTQAALKCSQIFQTQSAAVRALVQQDAYFQWVKWEQTANLKQYEKSATIVHLPFSKVSHESVSIQSDSKIPEAIRDYFIKSRSTLWVKHPHNKAKVPFMNTQDVGTIPALYSASRSMVLTGPLRGFTLKAPTDRPHGKDGGYQPEKANTADDVLSALIHSRHIENQDRLLGKDDKIIILPEVLTIADKKTNIGFVLRDTRALDDGNYYLPAFSIPYVGREISRLNGQNFELFWLEHYARLLGEAKARLLLRYGLQMETPNPQNMLIQLDRNLKPTGKIVFRDISDAFFVDGVAQALGFEKAVQKDILADYKPKKTLKPYISNSLWRLNEAGKNSVSEEGMKSWARAHNFAFSKYILNELKMNDLDIKYADAQKDQLKSLYQFLLSSEGQKALKDYASRK